MEIRNVKRWAKGGPEPYYVGAFGFLLAFSLRYALQPVLEDQLPTLFFAISCLVIAYYYGFWPSFLVLLASSPTALFFFTKPYNTFNMVDHDDIYMSIVNFSLVGLAAYMLELLRREQYKSALLARVSDTRYRLLVEADEDRREIMKKSGSASVDDGKVATLDGNAWKQKAYE